MITGVDARLCLNLLFLEEKKNLSEMSTSDNVGESWGDGISLGSGENEGAEPESGAKGVDPNCSFEDGILDFENRLVKQVVSNEFEAYRLYCDYAHAKGFSVRKGKQYYFEGSNQLRAKVFHCSKEGVKDDKRSKDKAVYTRRDERTGCPALIRFCCDRDNNWKVKQFVKHHNHEMVDPDQRHLLRSVRAICSARGGTIESHINGVLVPTSTWSLAARASGDVQHMGNTETDLYNSTNLLRRSKIEAGDSQTIVKHLKCKANEEGLFYWDVQLDFDGRIANIFWRDGRCRLDYELFGDVITFDTTYRTEGYDLVCALFVGVNHHGQNVIFGCGFLSDETSTSFLWLFETFLESMGGKQPKTIFSDQSQETMAAIPQIFSNSRHLLCQWHISKSAPSHLGSLNGNRGFSALFQKCMFGCQSEEEFDETWMKMMHNLNARENNWLKDLYELRHMWSTVFASDAFYAGLKPTSRSESTNRALNKIADRTTSLYQFLISFENMVKNWRMNEGEEDFRCIQGAPPLAIRTSQILNQVAKCYTNKMYKLFEDEFTQGVGAADLKKETRCSESVYQYEVVLHENGKVGIVDYDMTRMDIKCSCKKFETMGILCSHALRIFSLKNVHKIPEKYILRRWRKDARGRIELSDHAKSSKQGGHESEMVYSNWIMRLAYDLVMQSKARVDARVIVEQAFQDAAVKLHEYLANQTVEVQSSDSCIISNPGDANNENL